MNISQEVLKQRISSLVPPRNRNKKNSRDDDNNSNSSTSSSRRLKKKEPKEPKEPKVITIISSDSDSEEDSNITILREDKKQEKPKRFSFSYPKTESKPLPKKSSVVPNVITIDDSSDDENKNENRKTSKSLISNNNNNSNGEIEEIIISDNENDKDNFQINITNTKNKTKSDIIIDTSSETKNNATNTNIETTNNKISISNNIETKSNATTNDSEYITVSPTTTTATSVSNVNSTERTLVEEEEHEEENYIGFESSDESEKEKEEGKEKEEEDEENNKKKRKRNFEVYSRDILTPISIPPWIDENKKYSEYGPKMLHEEILDFVKYISPTPEEKYMREYAIKKITDVILDLWPDSIVKPYGSYKTNLYLPTSDIDLVILNEDLFVPSCFFELQEALQEADIVSKIEVIDKARIPIVKLVEKVTGYHFDISANAESGLNSAKLMEKFIETSGYGEAITALVLVIKQFLAQRYMNEVYSGGLGSYSVFILVTNFIMMHPCVQNKQILPQDNLGVLLLEFLELYGRVFNYEEVGIGISLKRGAYYYRKEDRDRYNYNRPRLLSIEDPDDPENDVGKNSFAVSKILQSFDQAFATVSGKMCAQFSRIQPGYKDELERERQRFKRKKSNIVPKHKRFSDDSNAEDDTLHFIEPYIRQCRSFLGSIIWIQKETEMHRQRIKEIYDELNP